MVTGLDSTPSICGFLLPSFLTTPLPHLQLLVSHLPRSRTPVLTGGSPVPENAHSSMLYLSGFLPIFTSFLPYFSFSSDNQFARGKQKKIRLATSRFKLRSDGQNRFGLVTSSLRVNEGQLSSAAGLTLPENIALVGIKLQFLLVTCLNCV